MKKKKLRILVNLPPGFFSWRPLQPVWARLRKLGLVRQRSHNTAEEIVRDIGWAEGIIMWSWPVLNEELLAQAPRLRFVGYLNGTQAAVRALMKRKVAVSEARAGWSPAVAEMALGLILNGLRRISDYHAEMRAGTEKWVADFPTDIDERERQLTGRSVGIVGFGRIGQRLAELLEPFRVELRAYDPFLPKMVARKYGAKLCTLNELVKNSEVVVLCAANNKGSENLIGAAQIRMMKRGCVLVNVGRASLIDMRALEERLRRGDMIALLDVFEREPLERDSVLRQLSTAYLTPHRAGGVMESVVRIVTMLVDDLEAYMEGRRRRWAMTEDMLASLPE
ncbi:MAG: hypothetical protein N2595_08170 [bacterium]|nr:hypothetical protein [bacterium]